MQIDGPLVPTYCPLHLIHAINTTGFQNLVFDLPPAPPHCTEYRESQRLPPLNSNDNRNVVLSVGRGSLVPSLIGDPRGMVRELVRGLTVNTNIRHVQRRVPGAFESDYGLLMPLVLFDLFTQRQNGIEIDFQVHLLL